MVSAAGQSIPGRRGLVLVISLLESLAVAGGSYSQTNSENARVFRAGAAAVDITPQEFPVRVSGSFFEHTTSEVKDRLYARCLVLDDGRERLAIAVVDNCVIPREIFDRAKELASEASGIAAERMLMSATHTHSGPALDGLLGSDGNPQYRSWLPGHIARAVQAASAHLAPARIGWAVVQDTEHTHCRQWIRRPDRVDLDPFGQRTVRSMMHPGHQNPDYLGPSGPVDPDLSILSVRSQSGKPIAVLANYSMHYVGAPPLSADYFGAFGEQLATLLQAENTAPPFVGIMSNGTSGDQHWMDYSRPKPENPPSHVEFAGNIARQVFEACKRIEYRDWVPLTMRERLLALENRPISDAELAKARELLATFKGRKPKALPEVYALEQVQLSAQARVHELKLQALKIGELGIAAIPCEAFGITGLQIKALSPLTPTFTIELANGYHGYIPPPAQHPLGGYTTWRARSACLEVEAAPKITEAVIALFEEISGKPRRKLTGDDYPFGNYPSTVLLSKPIAYWRLNESEGPQAADSSGHGNLAGFEPGVVFYLEGAGVKPDGEARRINRAPHFAGGRMLARVKGLGPAYSVELWFNNYLPVDAREITGYLISRGSVTQAAWREDLAIGGKELAQGKLLFRNITGSEAWLRGKCEVPTKSWHHLALVRDAGRVIVYLDGSPTPDIAGEVGSAAAFDRDQLIIGGSSERASSFEGRLDEVAVYDRVLSPEEVDRHYRAAVQR